MIQRTWIGRNAFAVYRSLGKIFGVNENVWGAISRLGVGGGGVLSASGVTVNAETAMLVAAYKRGVELLANHVAKVSYEVKRDCVNEVNHPASPLIRWWARHHQMSAFEYRRTMMVLALNRGNGYSYIVRRASQPIELLLLDSGMVFPQLIQGELWYRVTGRNGLIPASDMIHIKGLGFNGYEGLDPIRYYAKEVLGLALATQNYAATYYENGGTPSAYLRSEHPLTDDQFNRLKGEAGPLKRSIKNPHELPILEASEIKSVGLTAEQTQLLEARKDIILDIANMLGLPPHKLGLPISTSYGSLEEENEAFREDALDPWLVQFEMEYRKLLTEDEQATECCTIEACRDDIKRLKLVDKATYLSTLTGSAPLLTANEARANLGKPPIEGGDELLTPLNMGATPPATAAEAETETDTETESEDVQPATTPEAEAAAADDAEDLAEQEQRSAKLQALTDVYHRMARRLCVAASKVKRPEQLAELRSSLDSHAGVITAAFSPIVRLCGGRNPDPFAQDLLTEFRSRLDTLKDSGPDTLPQQMAELTEEFETASPDLAATALEKMT